ncbi:unnamed protein product [Durusdinium trenchii]|uniref:Uncharacterized protein n=1 Tax=Durusdinium trenchii TaxID=1381693 RepID=A0ABP0HAW4_9DINO
MEPDTVPYDADAEWQGWQVQVPSSFAVQNQAEVTPEAVPPTIMYDTFMAEPFSAPEPPAGRTAPAEDSTQAYEAVPGGIPQAFQVTPTHPGGHPGVRRHLSLGARRGYARSC